MRSDPHALTGAGTGAARSGATHTIPSEKPAGVMSNAKLKRARMFSSATMLVSSTSWRSSKCSRSVAKSWSFTSAGVRVIAAA
jgi:hypothetical protein